ncbi:MAG: hypothetical protein WBX01_12365 [Nitrososphaeraceae archaeon]
MIVLADLWTARDSIVKKIEELIKTELKSVPSEKKFRFLDQLNYDLGHIIGSNYKKMKLDHKKASTIPKWVKTGYSFIPYFDHFGRPNIIPRRRPNIIPRRPFDQKRFEECDFQPPGFYGNQYYLAFIQGCKSVEGNTEDICFSATDK